MVLEEMGGKDRLVTIHGGLVETGRQPMDFMDAAVILDLVTIQSSKAEGCIGVF